MDWPLWDTFRRSCLRDLGDIYFYTPGMTEPGAAPVPPGHVLLSTTELEPEDLGWHDPEDPHDYVALKGRILFLRMVEDVAQEALVALRDHVLTALIETAPEWREIVGPAADRPPLVVERWPEKARERLEEWMSEFGLFDPWAREVAARTVCFWVVEPPAEGELLRFRLDFAQHEYEEAIRRRWVEAQHQPPMLPLPGWNMCVEWSTYEQEMRKLTDRWLRLYKSYCESG